MTRDRNGRLSVRTLTLPAGLAALLLSSLLSVAQEKEPLTVEWTQGREPGAVAATPAYR